jgi:dipeptidase D
VTGLEPEGLWRHFEALTKIARPSGHEELVVEHVRAWAGGHGFSFRQDSGNNVVVQVPATAGRESAPTLVLQAHLDMVCERLPDSPNDPAEGRIALVRDGDWLTADGTTLGADDGIGVAAAMALAEDASCAHGPLELLLTVNEEVGGPEEGASALDPSLITGRMLLNLDSEKDGKLTIGSASSTDTTTVVELPREAANGVALSVTIGGGLGGHSGVDIALGHANAREAANGVALSVTIGGGLGGHSGVDIALGHANAIKVLGRVLREALAATPFRLASADGGRSWNAIPRDATAVCVVSDESRFREAVAAAGATIADAHRTTDPGVTVAVAAAEATDAWTEDGTRTLLDLLAVLPCGPLALSADFEGLVETSTSVGQIVSDGGRFEVHSLSRSSNAAALPDVMGALAAAARLAGGSFEVGLEDPGWRPNLDSPVLAVTRRVYEEEFGAEPVVTAVHAWLETAVIGETVPRLDMIAIGPQIEAPHSPDERVSIPTVERFWRLLVSVVDELART